MGMSEMAQPVILYGIKACDTMKKARDWLDQHGVDYDFHDYKQSGIDREHLQLWVDALGWEVVLNRAGTSFRKLPDAAKAPLDAGAAIALMLAQPSMIKRPILVTRDQIHAGFKPAIYASVFASVKS